MYVHEKVRAYIVENGLKQVVVAQKSHIAVETLNAILSGKQKMYAEDLKAICSALNVHPETFIDFESA